MDQRIINLYDEYTHQPLSRNEFLRRLALLAGGSAAAMALLPMIEVNYAHAAVTDDDGLFTERIAYPGVNGEMQAYVARPEKMKDYPAVIVIHENRGLNAHIEDVTRRAAKAGYLAIAPNALSALGKTPANENSSAAYRRKNLPGRGFRHWPRKMAASRRTRPAGGSIQRVAHAARSPPAPPARPRWARGRSTPGGRGRRRRPPVS